MEGIKALWDEVRELSLGSSGRVERLDSPPSPLQFMRDFVTPNKPCVISNGVRHWRALASWSDDYLSQALSDTQVSVHLTPNGRADALAPHPDDPSNSTCFASAHVQHMPFPAALDQIKNKCLPGKFVAYAQQQNDCFRSEYSALASDCDPHIPWASEALGCLPEAVNLWIGNHLSETSFHKDHYENLYVVISGEKHFTLLPPTDIHRMYIRNYPVAQYSYSQDSEQFRLEVEKPTNYVPWCSVDPYPPPEAKDKAFSEFPLYFNGPKPFQCTVKAGDILYLPSMWFHHVRQSPDHTGRIIAVNYWYDMQFDIKYAYFNFLQSAYCKSTGDPALPETESEREDSGCDSTVRSLGHYLCVPSSIQTPTLTLSGDNSS